MKTLEIKGDNKTPYVLFKPDGVLLMEGKAIPEDSKVLFNPILNWVSELEAKNVEMTVRLDYFNTSVSKQLATMYRNMEENTKIENIRVLWFYEEGDDDAYDNGLMYKNEFTTIDFEFFVFQ